MKVQKSSIDDLTFTDNFIFTRVLEANPDLCLELAEVVIGRKIVGFKENTIGKEHTISISPDSKGIRLDVYFEGSEALYDIEMQTADTKELGKRFRYYQGMMDQAYLQPGMNYSALPKSYIVFLCNFDAFQKGQVKYEFQNLCVTNPKLSLKDETRKIVVCSFGKESEDPKLNELLAYMANTTPTGELTRRLEQATQEAKRSADNRRDYMSYEMDLLIREQAAEERGMKIGEKRGMKVGEERGLKKGVKVGEERGKLEERFEMVLDGYIPLELAAKKSNLSIDAFKAELNRFQKS